MGYVWDKERIYGNKIYSYGFGDRGRQLPILLAYGRPAGIRPGRSHRPTVRAKTAKWRLRQQNNYLGAVRRRGTGLLAFWMPPATYTSWM